MQTLPDRIYFTGFMAAGKTTVGRMVANTLGFEFVDLDQRIEQRADTTIAELFASQGEQSFRAIEQQELELLADREEYVIALGGGALSSPGAWDRLGENRLVIYLRVPANAIARRIQYGRTVRPLMLDDQGNVLPRRDLTDKVRAMLRTREPDYNRADIIYDGGSRSVGVTVDRIVNLIRRHPGR